MLTVSFLFCPLLTVYILISAGASVHAVVHRPSSVDHSDDKMLLLFYFFAASLQFTKYEEQNPNNALHSMYTSCNHVITTRATTHIKCERAICYKGIAERSSHIQRSFNQLKSNISITLHFPNDVFGFIGFSLKFVCCFFSFRSSLGWMNQRVKNNNKSNNNWKKRCAHIECGVFRMYLSFLLDRFDECDIFSWDFSHLLFYSRISSSCAIIQRKRKALNCSLARLDNVCSRGTAIEQCILPIYANWSRLHVQTRIYWNMNWLCLSSADIQSSALFFRCSLQFEFACESYHGVQRPYKHITSK